MAKVRTLSRKFLTGHPKAGEPTFFVEQFLNFIGVDYNSSDYLLRLRILNTKNLELNKITFEQLKDFWYSLEEYCGIKSHTIRGGDHFKAGDFISIRTWSGKPYKDPQIIIWEDIEVKNVWPVFVGETQGMVCVKVKKSKNVSHVLKLREVANNDGLDLQSFLEWFKPYPFNGQIICWDTKIDY